ncbi:unnamed protein product [Effrenium voratum]|nr:unnamed protein product [Effrenium voratum]
MHSGHRMSNVQVSNRDHRHSHALLMGPLPHLHLDCARRRRRTLWQEPGLDVEAAVGPTQDVMNSDALYFGSLKYIYPSFNQMLGSMSPLITVLLAVLLQRKSFPLKTWLSMPVICAGLAVCSLKELNFNALGAFYCTGATVLRALKSLIQGRLLSPSHKLDSVTLLYYMAPMAAVWLSALMLLMEGAEPILLLLAGLYSEPGTRVTGGGYVLMLLVISGLNACLLNIANFLVTSYTSPVTLQVLGNVKSCLSIAVSVAIFRNSLTVEQAIGVGTCLIGVWLYNQKDQKNQKNQKVMASPAERSA